MIKIELKPVSVNEAFKGRRFKTEICEDYENDFFKVAPKREMIKGKIEIEYKFYMVNHGLSDYDNYIKITQDLLVKCGYIEDDRKIYKATIYKIPSKKNYIEIKIRTMN